MEFNNQFNSHDNSTQNISINYNIKNDIDAFEKALKAINVPDAEIDSLKNAICCDANSNEVANQKIGSNVQKAIKSLLTKIGDGIISSSITTVVPALTKALMNYYGYPVEF